MYTVDLPQIYEVGYHLFADDSSLDSLRLQIKCSPSYYGKRIKLRILSRGVVNLETQAMLSRGGIRLKIPNSTILPGVAYVQVLDEDENIVANRAVYLEDINESKVEITGMEESYSTREPGELNLKVFGAQSDSQTAIFSVSIFEEKYSPAEFLHLKQFLEFDAEISDKSSSINFNNLYRATPAEIDNYMLSLQAPEDLLKRDPIVNNYLNVISGIVLDSEGKPLADTVIVTSITGLDREHPVLLFHKTNESGRFSITLPPINGNFSVIVKVKDADELKHSVRYQIDQVVSSKEDTTRYKLSSALFELSKVSGYYKVAAENKVIRNSFDIQPIKMQEVDQSSFVDFTFDSFDESYNMNEYVIVTTLREVIIDILSGVTVRKTKDGLRIAIMPKDAYTKKFKEPFKTMPLILIDGVPVFSNEIIESISPADIKKIEVGHDHFYFGDVDIFGVFSITTYSGKILDRHDLNQYVHTSTGIQSDLSFSFPKYDGKSSDNKRIPDFRTLLYYNNRTVTNEKGVANVLFSTADSKGSYILLVEGITSSGKPVVIKKSFRVK